MGHAAGTEGADEPTRRRLAYATATAVAVAVGLASREFTGLFPAALGKYPGDALWSAMVFFGLGVVRPCASIRGRALWAIGLSCAVEFSQIYHAPWIDGVRRTLPGRLVLGYAFSWIDMVAYAVGVACGVACEVIVRRSSERGRS
jgi:hypothetical protein